MPNDSAVAIAHTKFTYYNSTSRLSQMVHSYKTHFTLLSTVPNTIHVIVCAFCARIVRIYIVLDSASSLAR